MLAKLVAAVCADTVRHQGHTCCSNLPETSVIENQISDSRWDTQTCVTCVVKELLLASEMHSCLNAYCNYTALVACYLYENAALMHVYVSRPSLT